MATERADTGRQHRPRAAGADAAGHPAASVPAARHERAQRQAAGPAH